MEHSKILLVAIVSAVVAIFTTVMGVTGTIIGSVISSVLYNVLVEIFEKPIDKKKSRKSRKSRKSFEWEIAYVFPLIIIAFIQLILIFAILSNYGILPGGVFLVYAFIQDLTDYNLFRIIGISLLIMSIYPFILNARIITKFHGFLLIIVGLLTLARGFSDTGFLFSYVLSMIFAQFDLYLAIFAFIVLLCVIIHIFSNKNDNKEIYHEEYYQNYDRMPHYGNRPGPRRVELNEDSRSFNSSSDNIQFDSRDNYYRKR